MKDSQGRIVERGKKSMKKIINGKKHDTNIAAVMGEASYLNINDFGHQFYMCCK